MTPGQENILTSRKRRFTIAFVVIVAAVVVFRLCAERKQRDTTTTIQRTTQAAQPVETNALDVVQAALDRSIEALTDDPLWREGFHQISVDNGACDVRILDASDDGNGVYDPSIPHNRVRIVATGRIGGVTKRIEAFWANPMSALGYAFCAGNEIRIDGAEGGGCVIVGDIHNNAWQDGELSMEGGNAVYGLVTSTGHIVIGSSQTVGPTTVHGSVTGGDVTIGEFGEVSDFEDLSEWAAGIDLNYDGDRDDLYVSRRSAAVGAARTVTSAGRRLSTGDTDLRVAGGTQPVDVGIACPGPVIDPRPNFTAYYEFVTGLSTYPPPIEHFRTDISGDGDGHYFASESRFLEWINSQLQVDAVCWRCAGDGHIGPENFEICPACDSTGKNPAVEITGVFYIDDDTLDLGNVQTNLIVHGTIVVASGNPYQWPRRTVKIPGETAVIDHFPQKGEFILGGSTRMHFTQTHRSIREGGPYAWRHRIVHSGDDEQLFAVSEPEDGQAMHGFPAVLAASRINITSRMTGFACCAGDVGDEAVTLLRGVLFAEGLVRIDGRGGWRGDPVIFDEEQSRGDDDVFDEAILRIDLNDDGDVLDRVKTPDISGRPVIRVRRGLYNVDINNDGVFTRVVLGGDYRAFFLENGFALPVLVYHEGTILGGSIHVGGQYVSLFDPALRSSAPPFGFTFGPRRSVRPGLLSWREVTASKTAPPIQHRW